ncbi:MAG: homoserine kinase [Streptosporangiaceae bacterium]|jgi:homoserine kinase
MALTHAAVRVRVPATSANLGPGFDALGLALSLYDDVDAWSCESGLSIEIEGEGADLAGAGEDHLVVRAMRKTFAALGSQPPGLGLRCVNRIPHGRGLGSSAAAIVAGILAARALVPAGAGALPDEALLGLATEMEGHPDNVAACLGGGLTIAWTEDGQPRMARLEPLASISPVICVGPAPVRTEVARRLLPALVPHADAAANAGRSALLVAALTQLPAETGALMAATRDWLHQDYRAEAMPETAALVGRLRAAGIPAVVSGAGPSVLALLSDQPGGRPGEPDYRHYLDRLGSIVRETGIAWHISSLDVERHGARVLRAEPGSGY